MVPVDPLAPPGAGAAVLTDAGAEILIADGRARALEDVLAASADPVPRPAPGRAVTGPRCVEGMRGDRPLRHRRVAARAARGRRPGRSRLHHLHLGLDRTAEGDRPHPSQRARLRHRGRRHLRAQRRRPARQHRSAPLRPVDLRAVRRPAGRRRGDRRARARPAVPGQSQRVDRGPTGHGVVLGSLPPGPAVDPRSARSSAISPRCGGCCSVARRSRRARWRA